MKTLKISTGLFVLVWSLPAFCSAAMYNVVDLGSLGGTNSQGNGINSSGQVTGWAYTAGNAVAHHFRTAAGRLFTPLGPGRDRLRIGSAFGSRVFGEYVGYYKTFRCI